MDCQHYLYPNHMKANKIDAEFVKRIEASYFRTNQDTGAAENAMFIWNLVRKHVGLPPLNVNDLPAYCLTHKTYHVILNEYGCKRKD